MNAVIGSGLNDLCNLKKKKNLEYHQIYTLKS